MTWLAVALGGALGSLLRFALVMYTPTLGTARLPLGTLVVNCLGCLAIGVAYVLLVEYNLLSTRWRHFFIAGVLGGFTTFSSFALETLQLIAQGQALYAIAYVAASVTLGLVMAYVGILLAQNFF